MEWVYPKRRGPEWKQSWTTQILTNISSPPLPLLAVFAIVVFLLSLSQYTTLKSQLENSKIILQLVLCLVPVVLIIVIRSNLIPEGRITFWGWSQRPRQYSGQQTGASPWGAAVLLVVLLVLVSYQSSFHSRWFAFEN